MALREVKVTHMAAAAAAQASEEMVDTVVIPVVAVVVALRRAMIQQTPVTTLVGLAAMEFLAQVAWGRKTISAM